MGRTKRWVAVAAMLTIAACGGGDDTASSTPTPTPSGEPGVEATPGNNADDDADAATASPSADGTPAPPTPPPLAFDICEALPAADVAAALGVPSVEPEPAPNETPQCSYEFEIDDGVRTDATVSILRTEEDLGGREGEAAFDYVLELNRDAAGEPPTETVLDVGDEAVLLTGDNLHFGVVRYGLRIVTTIVTVRAADAAAAAELTRATQALVLD